MESVEMSSELAVMQQNGQVRPILPMNIEDAFRLAKAFAMAEMLPKSYMTGTAEKAQAMAFTAMQLGAEVGMSPMQSIQSIAVVNGMPSIWGDAQKALVISSNVCEYIRESYTGNPFDDNYTAICTVKRKGQEEVTEEFSVADARKAGLWDKTGTWSAYPKRMLKYRARSFALRDVFPDVLKGLTHSAEELDGMEDVTPQPKVLKGKKERKEATEINDILTAQIGVPVELYQEKVSSDNISVKANDNEAEKQDALAQARASVAAATGKEVIQPEPAPVVKANEPVIADAARKRMETIRNSILETKTPELLRELVNEQSSHIAMLPEMLSQKIYDSIAIQKEKLNMSPGEDLFGG